MDEQFITDVVELKTSYKYIHDVIEKTSIQVDHIQHQTNKIPLLLQRHEDFMLSMGELKGESKNLRKDHEELKAEVKSWINKGVGGWFVAGLVGFLLFGIAQYMINDVRDSWKEMKIEVRELQQKVNTNK